MYFAIRVGAGACGPPFQNSLNEVDISTPMHSLTQGGRYGGSLWVERAHFHLLCQGPYQACYTTSGYSGMALVCGSAGLSCV